MTIKNYFNYAYNVMRKSETNEFVFKRWFEVGGLNNFKNDVSPPDKNKYIMAKIDNEKPFSPSNYRWISPAPIIKKPYKKQVKFKLERSCKALTFLIQPDIDVNIGGIYKMTFSNGWIYIGSTHSFRKRICCWNTKFNTPEQLHNKKMKEAVALSDGCYFEVMQYEVNMEYAKKKETEIILSLKNLHTLINRAYTGYSNEGIVWTDEEKTNKSISMKEKYATGQLKAKGRPKK